MIVLAQNLILTPGALLNTPVFGWQSLVTTANISASSEETDHPATDLANPSTVLFWRAADPSPPADVYITVDIDQVDDIDYLAVAGHNFGSAGLTVSLEIATALEGSPGALNWTEVIEPRLLTGDDPLLFRFAPTSVLGVRLRLQPGSATAQAAVVFVGRLLVLQRGTSDSHVPINFARVTRRLRQTSQNGHYLGDVRLAEGRQNAISFKYLDQDWYRANMSAFVGADLPFFFAWKPQERPDDVGYCSLVNDAQPLIDFETQTVAIDLQMEGVAL